MHRLVFPRGSTFKHTGVLLGNILRVKWHLQPPLLRSSASLCCPKSRGCRCFENSESLNHKSGPATLSLRGRSKLCQPFPWCSLFPLSGRLSCANQNIMEDRAKSSSTPHPSMPSPCLSAQLQLLPSFVWLSSAGNLCREGRRTFREPLSEACAVQKFIMPFAKHLYPAHPLKSFFQICQRFVARGLSSWRLSFRIQLLRSYPSI